MFVGPPIRVNYTCGPQEILDGENENMKTERRKGKNSKSKNGDNKEIVYSFRPPKKGRNDYFKLPSINNPAKGESDIDCYDDDDDSDSDNDLDILPKLDNTKKDKEYFNSELPIGVICKDCAKIGVYTRSADVKRVIQQSAKRFKKSAYDGRKKERCSICNNLNSSDVKGHENILLTVLYSHTFYDKFSREKKVEFVDNVVSDSKDHRKGPQVSSTDAALENSSRKQQQNSTDLKPKQIQKQTETRKKDNVNPQQTSAEPKKVPVPPLSLSDDPKDFKDTDSENEDNNVSEKPAVAAVHTLLPDEQSDNEAASYGAKNISKRRLSESFSTLYRKRAMKGSTVRKDSRMRNEIHQKQYTVESLGLTFGIPEFNFHLAGKTILRPVPGSSRSGSDSSSRPDSLLPPIKPEPQTPVSAKST